MAREQHLFFQIPRIINKIVFRFANLRNMCGEDDYQILQRFKIKGNGEYDGILI